MTFGEFDVAAYPNRRGYFLRCPRPESAQHPGVEVRAYFRYGGQPPKGLLLGLFFVSVGVGLDMALLVANPMVVISLMFGILALKGVLVFGLACMFRLRRAAALEAALLLAAGGEFSFVILNSAIEESLIDRLLEQTVLVSSTLSMFCIPLLATAGAAIRRRSAT